MKKVILFLVLSLVLSAVIGLVGCGGNSLLTYTVGDTGPAGGLIFYDKGSYSDGWRYLEAAPVSTEWTAKQWGSYGTEIGATGTAIGTGQANTTAIVAAQGAGNYAAQLCNDLTEGGYIDWFLPSKDELNLMYQNLHFNDVGGFAASPYWSSSEYSPSLAWYQNFGTGSQYGGGKGGTDPVRAVRAF